MAFEKKSAASPEAVFLVKDTNTYITVLVFLFGGESLRRYSCSLRAFNLLILESWADFLEAPVWLCSILRAFFYSSLNDARVAWRTLFCSLIACRSFYPFLLECALSTAGCISCRKLMTRTRRPLLRIFAARWTLALSTFLEALNWSWLFGVFHRIHSNGNLEVTCS